MKYLVAVRPDYVPAADVAKYAPNGEPVIPNYPAPADNVFIGTISFLKSIHAVVCDVPDIGIDLMCERLCKQYPGLPKRLHENYIFHTARAATAFPVGTRFRIYITSDNTKLHEIGGKEELFTLWDEQPLS